MSLLQIALNLEKVFLMVASLKSNQLENVKGAAAKDLDIMEKRVAKEKQKTMKAVKKWLAQLYLEYSMLKMDRGDDLNDQKKS